MISIRRTLASRVTGQAPSAHRNIQLKAAPIRERQEEQDRQDFDLILAAYKMHGYTKGAKGIYMALLHMDPPVNG